jgi:hypothetical protein
LYNQTILCGGGIIFVRQEAIVDIQRPTATATNEVENEFRFQYPFTANITGPTGCGKTYFVKTLPQNCRTKMMPPPQRIVWLYKRWQPLYDVIRKTVFPRVEFRRGILMDLHLHVSSERRDGLSIYRILEQDQVVTISPLCGIFAKVHVLVQSDYRLRNRPTAERRISLNAATKLSDQDGATAAENRMVVQEMATPLRHHPKDRVPTSRICHSGVSGFNPRPGTSRVPS